MTTMISIPSFIINHLHQSPMKRSLLLAFSLLLITPNYLSAQGLPVMETGGKVMPNEWIDKDTGHRVIKLTRRDGANRSFYFHNHPFIGDEMLFVGSDVAQASTDMLAGNGTQGIIKQMYAVNLKTLKIRQVTHEAQGVSTEIVCPATREIFFQRQDSVFACAFDDGAVRFIAKLPAGRTGRIVTINCDGTRLAGTFNNPEEARITREHPKKSEFFSLIFEAKLEKTIFTIDTKTGKFTNVWTDNAWLNHLQFSPTDPNRLLFCHEGHWHKVDRIWNIDIRTRQELDLAGLSEKPEHKPVLMHKRTVYREIAGHEWFGADGRYIYFDLQKPRGTTFYVGKVDVETLHEEIYPLLRDEWAVHYTTSWDETFLAGDGGSKTSVAHSNKDQWIHRYNYPTTHNSLGGTIPTAEDSIHTIVCDTLKTEKLVNMKNHNYNLEPNVHFSPDNKWVIFRANFEGFDNVYAVEL